MASALKVPEGRFKLKLGRSFDKKSKATEKYQTIRYDFKPASVEDSKETYAEFGSTSEVVVSIPKLDANNEVKDVTLFKGSRKPCQKECLLIYDHDTGEFILEELSSNIHLKQIRSSEEGKEKNLQYVKDIRKKFVKNDNSAPVNAHVPTILSQQKNPKVDIMSDQTNSSEEEEGEASDDDDVSNSDGETGSEDDDKNDIANALEAELGAPSSDHGGTTESNLQDDLHLSDTSEDDD